MEFAPIPGIRTDTLLNVQKPSVDRIAPRFEIEASERPGDDPESSKQQAPERGLAEEEEPETVEQAAAAADGDAEKPENENGGRFSWFV
jgi:hypothetical protein